MANCSTTSPRCWNRNSAADQPENCLCKHKRSRRGHVIHRIRPTSDHYGTQLRSVGGSVAWNTDDPLHHVETGGLRRKKYNNVSAPNLVIRNRQLRHEVSGANW